MTDDPLNNLKWTRMTAREKENTGRHYLLHLNEIPKIWHQKEWIILAAVVEYAQGGIPPEMSKTDPYMYRALCAALAEYHIHGYDQFNLEAIKTLAEKTTR